jgi:LysR family nitrogen assimilation transcriptional regulator
MRQLYCRYLIHSFHVYLAPWCRSGGKAIMDTSKFAYFSAIVEHGSISHAAEALRISQPTLTRQVQTLEQQFGATLLVRHGRGVVLTEAGRRLSEGLRGLERQIRSLRDDVGAAAKEPSGEVAIGIPPSPRSLLATDIVSKFAQQYPKVRIRVVEETSGRIRDHVASGVLDLAITTSVEPDRGLRTEPLVMEPLLLIGPRDAKLQLRRKVRISDVARLPLILTMSPNSIRRIIEDAFASSGLRPVIGIEANTLPFMTDLVEAGLGYTMLPLSGVNPIGRHQNLSATQIEGMTVTWVLAYPENRPMSPNSRLFARVISEEIGHKIAKGLWPLATRLAHPKW